MTPGASMKMASTKAMDAHGAPVARWLLTVPQLAAGPHAGAVAGLLEDGRTPAYVYPEIAGYYLRWLAFRAERFGDDGRLARHAAALQRWLVHWTALAGPPTRVPLDGSTGDWRNDAIFCFDLAMVLRGLGSASHARLIAVNQGLVAAVAALLERCIAADGAFDAVVPLHGGAVLPDRWSTRRGAFLAKAAAGVLRASSQLPGVRAALVGAAERTLSSSVASLVHEPHPEVHPLLYACEGILDLPRHPRFASALPAVSRAFAAIATYLDTHGELTESMRDGGPARIDIVAQALRVGCLLAAHDARPAVDPALLARLRALLDREMSRDGGVRFARHSPPVQRNTWAAMFTDQALAFAAADLAAACWWRDDPLIV